MGWLTAIGGIVAGALNAVGTGLGIATSLDEQKHQRAQQDFNNNIAISNIIAQQQAFEYQKSQDAWARDVTERNMNLAERPISTLLNDASKHGINPMAAMGQSVGSAQASSSNVSTPSNVSGVSTLDTGLSSMLSSIGGLAQTQISTKSQEKIAEKNASLRQQELNLIANKQKQDYDVAKEQNAIEQQNANTNEYNAQSGRQSVGVQRDTLSQRQVEFAFEKTKTKKYYALDKLKMQFEHRMSREQFARAKYNFEKEYNLARSKLNNEIVKTRNQKDFNKDYIRMRYLTAFGHEISSIAQKFFGLSAPETEIFRKDFMDEILGQGLSQ